MIEHLQRLRQKKIRRIIGLLSGTSVDGIDAALVEVAGSGLTTKAKLSHFASYPFPAGVRERIFELFSPQTGTVEKICHLNFLLGELFADAALAVCREAGISSADVDLIGSHGQTIYHRPDPTLEGPYETRFSGENTGVAEQPHQPLTAAAADRIHENAFGQVEGATLANQPAADRGLISYQIRSTLQLGEAAVIAERTGITTVSDFRTRDMAAGGQGAPLVPYVDFLLFRDEEKGRALQNIGGIGNVTYLVAGGSLEELLAFDTGPGNMIIDALVKLLGFGEGFDRDGRIAASGKVNEEMLADLLKHPYYFRQPPKTTGREDFGEQYARFLLERYEALAPEELVATATALTVESIALAYRSYLFPRGPVEEVIVAGGGSYNPTLMRMLEEALARHLPQPTPPRLYRVEDFGISSEAKEAIAFAILANETLHGLPGNVPGATGAARRVVLGKVVPGNLLC